MAGILIEHARFVEAQHRRARRVAARGRPPETPAPTRTPPHDIADPFVDVPEPAMAGEAAATHRGVDVR